MISAAKDPSLHWAATCDMIRTKVTGLPTAAGCFLYPSIEAALTELAFLLADREREVGGARNIIAYGQLQDPALDRMAKAISSTGIEAKPKRDADWLDIATWITDLKSKALFVAYAEDDRFSGRIHDTSSTRSALFADGMRIPVITLSMGSHDWRTTLPRSFEIRVYPLSGSDPLSTAAIAVVGERLRLEPRMAPLTMDPSRLESIEDDLAIMPATASLAPDVLATENLTARTEIENFEAATPAKFQAWWPKGSSRLLDRAIVTSKDFEGSFVIDRLRETFSKTFETPAEQAMLERGLFSISGCTMNDERRQEWLRSRGDDAWLIRGAIHISRELIRAVPLKAWTDALSDLK